MANFGKYRKTPAGEYPLTGDKNMRAWRILIILTSLITCPAASIAADSTIVEKLGLASTKIAGVNIYYEKCFKSNLHHLEKLLTDLHAGKQTDNDLLAKKDIIVNDIKRILAITDPNNEPLSKLLTEMTQAFDDIKLPSFVLVTQTTTKDYLRAGGKLPDFEYDKETDTVSYRSLLWSDPKSFGNLQLTLPLPSPESLEKEGLQMIEALTKEVFNSKSRMVLAIHEVAEILIYQKIEPKGPYWRWFTNGFANAITYEILKKHASRADADYFAKLYDTAEYKDIEREINLQYWMKAQYCPLQMGRPIDYEQRISLARYAFATYEARRLIDANGIECVTAIANKLCEKPSRTTDDLLAAIKHATGRDMAERFARYQTFETAEQGQSKYAPVYNEAFDAKDPRKMLTNLLRTMELQGTSNPDNLLRNWSTIASLLFQMGFEQEADLAMKQLIELFDNPLLPNGRYAALERFMAYALACRKPQKASDVAEEFLKFDPKNPVALTVRMLMLRDIKEMQKIARTIQSLVKNTNSMPHQYAAMILSIDPNNPPPPR